MVFLKDKDKQALLDRYFDIEWLDDVSDLRCVRCHRVAINHFMSSCQHIFCGNCRKFYSAGEQLTCPQCEEFISQLDDQDFDAEVKIHKIRVFCPNKKLGCNYADQLRKIPPHLKTCEDAREAALHVESLVTNTLDLEDSNNTIANKNEDKLNQLEKKTDDISSKVNVLKESLTNVSKKVEDTHSGMELASKQYAADSQSIKTLLETIVQRIQKNESLLHHTIEQTSSNIEELKIKMVSLTQQLTTLHYKKPEELRTLKSKICEWKLTNVEKTILKDKWLYESGVFTFTGYSYGIRAKFEKREGSMAIHVQFKDGRTVNKQLSKSGFTKVQYIIRDQTNTQEKKDIIFESDLSFFDCFAYPQWIFGQGLTSSMLSPPYTMNDCIKITMLFQPASIDRSYVSSDGVLMWRVDNYSKEQFYHDVLSPTFYTSPHGYRVRAGLLINCSKILGIEVIFLTGEHDASLSLHFPHKTTVTLFNQSDPSKNLVKIDHREHLSIYSIQLKSCKLIEQQGFIKDDSLLLKVMIEPIVRK